MIKCLSVACLAIASFACAAESNADRIRRVAESSSSDPLVLISELAADQQIEVAKAYGEDLSRWSRANFPLRMLAAVGSASKNSADDDKRLLTKILPFIHAYTQYSDRIRTIVQARLPDTEEHEGSSTDGACRIILRWLDDLDNVDRNLSKR